MSKSANGYREFHRDISGKQVFTTTTDDTTLVTSRSANHTIYIQRIIGYVTTDAAQSIAFEDSNGTPFKIAHITTSPGDETRWDFWFGDAGIALTEGKNFVANVSATGLALNVVWEGYERITTAMAASTNN